MIRYRTGEEFAAYWARCVQNVGVAPAPAAFPAAAQPRDELRACAQRAMQAHGRNPTSFLDVGCRTAPLAALFLNTPVRYQGVEPSEPARVVAHSYGRDVRLEPTGPADVVFLRQMLQFVQDLPVFFVRLRSWTAPGGVIVVAQSLPYGLECAHHWNAVDGITDLLPLLVPFTVEIAEHEAGCEAFIVARRPT